MPNLLNAATKFEEPVFWSWLNPAPANAESVFEITLRLKKVGAVDPIISAGLLCYTGGSLNAGAQTDAFARGVLSSTAINDTDYVLYTVKISVGNGPNDIRPNTDAVVLSLALENTAGLVVEYFGFEDIQDFSEINSRIETIETVQSDNAQRLTIVETSSNDNAAAITAEAQTSLSGRQALASDIQTIEANVVASNAAITAESTARASADTALGSRIDTVETDVAGNTALITTEATSRANADSALGTRIDTVETNVSGVTASVTSEAAARSAADNALGTRIDSVETDVAGNAASISSETTARSNADSALGLRIDTVETDVSGNTASITALGVTSSTADTALGARIDSVETNVSGNTASIASEATARSNADTALGGRIDSVETDVAGNTASIINEVTARSNADTALGNLVTGLRTDVDGNAADITSESTARSSADSALGTRIDSVETDVAGNTASIATEATTRSDADTALGSRIDTVETNVAGNTASITTETTARSTADTALGARIDTVEADVDGNTASITAESIARANADTAIAASVTSLTATVDGNSTSITQQDTVLASIEGVLAAERVIRVGPDGRASSLVQRAETTGGITVTSLTFDGDQMRHAVDGDIIWESTAGGMEFRKPQRNVGPILANGSRYMEVRGPGNFGATYINAGGGSALGDLLMWYGPYAATNDACSLTNCVRAMGIDGQWYEGGAAAPNAPQTDSAENSSTAGPTLEATTDEITSTGNNVEVTFGYQHSFNAQYTSDPDPQMPVGWTPTATILLQVSKNQGAFTTVSGQTKNLSGDGYKVDFSGGSFGGGDEWYIQQVLSGSFSYIDTSMSSGDTYQFKVKMTARYTEVTPQSAALTVSTFEAA